MKLFSSTLIMTALLTSTAHAITNTEIAQEISTNTLSAEASLSEMISVYKNRISTFNAAMKNTRHSKAQKKAIAKNFLSYAKSEISNQTGGWGVVYTAVMLWESEVESLVDSNRLNEATESVNQYAGTLLSIL